MNSIVYILLVDHVKSKQNTFLEKTDWYDSTTTLLSIWNSVLPVERWLKI